MQFRKGIYQLLKYGNNIIEFIRNNPQEKYFIEITEIYTNQESGEIMIEYFIPTCGVTDDITSSEFLNSPLIFAVHPMQIYLLGVEAGKCVIKVNKNNNPISFLPLDNRMKRYLH